MVKHKLGILILFLALSIIILKAEPYYWAKDYYLTSDFIISSASTYSYNTYYNGDKYNHYEDYLQEVYNKNYGWLNLNSPNQNKGNGDSGVKGTYYYYSKTLNKYVEKECYIIPPKNKLVYTKCR